MAAWFNAGERHELVSDRPEGRVKIATLTWDGQWCLYLWTLDKTAYEKSLSGGRLKEAKRWAVGAVAVAFDEAIGDMMSFQGELVNGEVGG